MGYAFVHYESSQAGREAATRAVEAVQELVADGVRYTAEFSRNFRRGVTDDSGIHSFSTSDASSPLTTVEGGLGHVPYAPGLSAMGMSGYPSAYNAATVQSQAHVRL